MAIYYGLMPRYRITDVGGTSRPKLGSVLKIGYSADPLRRFREHRNKWVNWHPLGWHDGTKPEEALHALTREQHQWVHVEPRDLEWYVLDEELLRAVVRRTRRGHRTPDLARVLDGTLKWSWHPRTRC